MSTPNVSDGEIGGMPLSETLLAASKIDGVDVELALSRISGKQSILENCIEQTSNAAGEELQRMTICLSKGDMRGFSIEAHGLKVALAGIGATVMSEQAARLEYASKAGDEMKCKQEFIGFAGRMKVLASELKAALPRDDRVEKTRGDSKLLKQVAKEAADFLREFESDDALSCMCKLDGFTFGAENDALIEHIRGKVKAYKYGEASLLLRSIVNT